MFTLINAQFVFYTGRRSEKTIKKAFQDSLINVCQSRNLYDVFPDDFNEKGDSFIGLKLITYGGYKSTVVSMYGNLRCNEPYSQHLVEVIERALSKLGYVALCSAIVLVSDEIWPHFINYIYRFDRNLDKKLFRMEL